MQKGFFPSIPDVFEDLSIAQKAFLYRYGAGFTLYLLGKIDTLYKVINNKDQEIFQDNFEKTLHMKHEKNRPWVFNFREQKLKEEVSRFLTKPGFLGKIVIIYGAGHDFSYIFGDYEFEIGKRTLFNGNLHWYSTDNAEYAKDLNKAMGFSSPLLSEDLARRFSIIFGSCEDAITNKAP